MRVAVLFAVRLLVDCVDASVGPRVCVPEPAPYCNLSNSVTHKPCCFNTSTPSDQPDASLDPQTHSGGCGVE